MSKFKSGDIVKMTGSSDLMEVYIIHGRNDHWGMHADCYYLDQSIDDRVIEIPFNQLELHIG